MSFDSEDVYSNKTAPSSSASALSWLAWHSGRVIVWQSVARQERWSLSGRADGRAKASVASLRTPLLTRDSQLKRNFAEQPLPQVGVWWCALRLRPLSIRQNRCGARQIRAASGSALAVAATRVCRGRRGTGEIHGRNTTSHNASLLSFIPERSHNDTTAS